MLAGMVPLISELSSMTDLVKWAGVGVVALFALGFTGITIVRGINATVERRRIPTQPRKAWRQGVIERRGEIKKQLDNGTLGGIVLGPKRRAQLFAERALIDAELAHLGQRSDAIDADRGEAFAGMSRGGMLGARERLRRERAKLLADLDSGLMKPGPDARQRLFAIGDEIVALEEALGGFTGAGEQGSGSLTMQEKFDAITAIYDQLIDRWGEWHTDLGLLTEFPAIHDVQHEEFARRIIDAQDAAGEARAKAEAHKEDTGSLEHFSVAIEEFSAALDDGEHKARLIARGPALDPVLNRIMTTAETLLAKIHDYQTGSGAVSWGECQVAAGGLVKLLKPVIGHQADAIPELEAAIARELEPARE